MQWLNENDSVCLEFLNSAFNKDKADGVSIYEHSQGYCLMPYKRFPKILSTDI